ncbi:MAG TPA: archaeosortase/exosortase family protein [archaeon]|nr:archaeosortase/exosortase family protein [archaeon]
MKIRENEISFLVKFFAVFGIAELLIFLLDFSVLQNRIASEVAGFFGLEYFGNTIFVQGGAFEIVSSCTGIVSISILASIIFSLKKPPLRQKAGIFIAGAALLLALNYLRVFLVIFAGKEYGIFAGEVVHIVSWFTTAAFVIGLWYYFTKKITGVKDFSGFL